MSWASVSSLPWFRLYTEFLTDPLIRMLAFDDQRHFIAALCMKASGVTDKRYASDEVRRHVLASLLGLSDRAGTDGVCAMDAANQRLAALGLIDENWQPTNWEKRQFRSDHADPTAAERMRRYRSKRNVTTVTPVVTALDTEQIQNRTEQKQSKRALRASRVPPDFVPDLDLARKTLPDIDAEREAQKFRDWEFKTPRSDWAAAWRNWIESCREKGRYARKSAAPAGMEGVQWR